MKLTTSRKLAFQRKIRAYYQNAQRSFPWRETTDPYAILVSEVMLQQTQTDRVINYYTRFLTTFPTLSSLAHASVQELLTVWKGLGYNRRALALQRAAQIITTSYAGKIPNEEKALIDLPGIGPYTARAILAFAFHIPTPLIETNIRTVYLAEFFPKRRKVSDHEILTLIEQTLDKKNPREWYYALMDYGVKLKKEGARTLNQKSAHYRKQSPFKGSRRALRGEIVRTLTEQTSISKKALLKKLKCENATLTKLLDTLEKEGFLENTFRDVRILS